jgi:hypothetical protein
VAQDAAECVGEACSLVDSREAVASASDGHDLVVTERAVDLAPRRRFDEGAAGRDATELCEHLDDGHVPSMSRRASPYRSLSTGS